MAQLGKNKGKGKGKPPKGGKPPAPAPKGKGKGKPKGGKAQGAVNVERAALEAAVGIPDACRDWNSSTGCTRKECWFHHVCSQCGGKHKWVKAHYRG